MTLDRQQRDWEELAEHDPLWAILSVDEKARGGWDVEEFFDTGGAEMDRVMDRSRQLGYPTANERALDFGCGVGRVTRAMASHFAAVVGVDISPTMVESARNLNETCSTCRFEVNDRADLRRFADGEFDLVYSNIVLQHIPRIDIIEGYIREFVRVLRHEGLLVFQLPTAIPIRYRLQPRRRAYSALRAIGAPPVFLRGRLGLHPIRMNCIAEVRVLEILDSERAYVLGIDRSTIAGFGIPSNTYWVTLA
jgi:SAM-dependent methyltransferase